MAQFFDDAEVLCYGSEKLFPPLVLALLSAYLCIPLLSNNPKNKSNVAKSYENSAIEFVAQKSQVRDMNFDLNIDFHDKRK